MNGTVKLSIFVCTLATVAAIAAVNGANVPELGDSDVLSRQPRWLWPWEEPSSTTNVAGNEFDDLMLCPEGSVCAPVENMPGDVTEGPAKTDDEPTNKPPIIKNINMHSSI